VEFYSVDTLTGRIVGRLYPHAWELSDPLRSPGTGSLSVAIPDEPDRVAQLIDLTLQRRRWVAAKEGEQFLWCGPISDEPSRSSGTLTIPLVDWRSWFYRTPLRPFSLDPTAIGARRNYIKTGTAAREQTLIISDLMTLALDTTGKPLMVVDVPPTTGVKREITALMLDRAIAEYMDDVTGRGSFDWWVYCTQSDPTHLLLHAAACWPERAYRSQPIKLEWQLGKGGNVSGVDWPGGQGASTRVWAVGEGEPPDQVFTRDEFPEIADGTEVAWESVLGPLDGVKTTATAFEQAHAAITRSRGFDRTVEFTVATERIPLTSCATGDRARVVYYDGWVDVDIPAARIISRTLSGGRGQPTTQRLSIDLSDAIYPEYDTGEDVDDE
jgi:hypothetical protein